MITDLRITAAQGPLSTSVALSIPSVDELLATVSQETGLAAGLGRTRGMGLELGVSNRVRLHLRIAGQQKLSSRPGGS